MHKLIFRNKWFAAGWAAMTLFSIYMAAPREENGFPGGAMAAAALGPGEADATRTRDELVRQAELAAFNAAAEEEPVPDDAEFVAE